MAVEFKCAICLEVDPDGRIYQCDEGHYLCANCYDGHVEYSNRHRIRPKCPTCRLKLVNGTPVRCLAAEQAIRAKKEAIRAEVRHAEAEADAVEVANAVAAADAPHRQRKRPMRPHIVWPLSSKPKKKNTPNRLRKKLMRRHMLWQRPHETTTSRRKPVCSLNFPASDLEKLLRRWMPSN